MTLLLPALLAGGAAAVAVGLPAPRRVLTSRQPASWRAGRSRAAALLPVVVGLGSLLLLGPVGGLLAVGLAVLARRVLAARARRAARAAERAGAAEALAVLAAELRAGRAPDDALERAARVAVGTTRQALAGAAAAGRVGGAPHDVLQRAAATSTVGELLSGLAACWQVCQGTGSSLAAAVDRLADALREESITRDVVESELAGPRATATMLAVLPVIGTVLAAGLGAHPVHVLLHTSVGVGCLVAGLAFEAAGLWWTGRIVAAAGGEA